MGSKQFFSDLLVYIALIVNLGIMWALWLKVSICLNEIWCIKQDILAIKALIYDLRYNVIYSQVEERRIKGD